MKPGRIDDPRPWPLHSAIDGIEWPALPGGDVAPMMSLLHQLEQSQWWSPELVAEHQFRQLSRLLDHVAKTVPFYEDQLEAVGYTPEAVVDPKRWSEMPILRRPEVQMAGEALESNAIPASHGKTFVQMTSGSTGRPIRTLGTGVTNHFWKTLTLRDHHWHRRDVTRKLAVIRQFPAAATPPPEGAATTNWGPATTNLVKTGACLLYDINHTVRQQAEWLVGQAPGYILTYPSNARALARHFRDHDMALPSLLEMRTFGEVVEPSARHACRDGLGVPLVDMYSSQEVGYIALQCPANGSDHYHVQSESLLVEVVDDNGMPCRPGEVGAVVVTTLHNFATPLLRYALGDFAEVGEPCSCGRGLPVITRVLGRQRNMLTLSSGDQLWPTFGDPDDFRAAVAHLPPILQFQAIQHTVDSLEVKLVSPGTFGVEEESAMRAYLESALGHPFDITFTYVDEIPRSPGGKFEDFKSEVEAR